MGLCFQFTFQAITRMSRSRRTHYLGRQSWEWTGSGGLALGQRHICYRITLSVAVPAVGDLGTTAAGCECLQVCVLQVRVNAGLRPSCSSPLCIQGSSMHSSPELWPEATKTPISELHRWRESWREQPVPALMPSGGIMKCQGWNLELQNCNQGT